MKATKLIGTVLWLLVVTPIWYYLIYQVLKRVDASDVMWLLYWIYVPVGLISALCIKIAEGNE